MIDATGAFATYGSVRDGGQPGPYGGYCDYWGRAYGCGSIFKVAPPAGGRGAWTTTTLYEFTGSTDGGEQMDRSPPVDRCMESPAPADTHRALVKADAEARSS